MADFDEEKQNIKLEELHQKEEEELIKNLAQTKYNLPYINLNFLGIDNEALRIIPEAEARELKVAPFRLAGKKIFIALHSPSEEIIEKLKKDSQEKELEAEFFMASSASLKKAWDRYQELSMAENTQAGGLDIAIETLKEISREIKNLQDLTKITEEVLIGHQVHKISHLLEIILAGAITVNASDIHIEMEEEKGRLRMRLDGILHDITSFKKEIYHSLNIRIKLLSGMKLTSKNAQDGRFSITESNEEIDVRTSVIPSAYGESIVMRILDPKTIQLEIEQLGIEKNLFNVIKDEISKPNGLILVTGPTGSGKTTTLYAFLKRIYSPEIKIITIEDPIEYHLTGVTQTQTHSEKGYNFSEGLRSALRQDPDVVMVGEIRDGETAKIAIESALTGHLVFSTLHTNNAAGVIPRLIDLGVNPKIMVSALSLSIAQRLVRKLCPVCKKKRPSTPEEEKIIQTILNKIQLKEKDLTQYDIAIETPLEVFEAGGCEKCNLIGYKGRIGILEAIQTDEAIEKIIPENPSEREIKKTAENQKILTMREDGIVKILQGVTSFQEVLNVVDLKEE